MGSKLRTMKMYMLLALSALLIAGCSPPADAGTKEPPKEQDSKGEQEPVSLD